MGTPSLYRRFKGVSKDLKSPLPKAVGIILKNRNVISIG